MAYAAMREMRRLERAHLPAEALAVLREAQQLHPTLALGYAITVPTYALSVVFGIADSTTFAIVMCIGFVQLAVAGIGSDSDNGLRNPDRRADVAFAVPQPRNHLALATGGMAQGADHLSQNRGGR